MSNAFRLHVRRGSAYWTAASILIGTQEEPGPFYKEFGFGPIMACSAGEIRHHLQSHLQSRVDKLWDQRWSVCRAALNAQRQLEYERQRAEWQRKYADVRYATTF